MAPWRNFMINERYRDLADLDAGNGASELLCGLER